MLLPLSLWGLNSTLSWSSAFYTQTSVYVGPYLNTRGRFKINTGVEDMSSRVTKCDQSVNKFQQTVTDMKHPIEYCMLKSEKVANQNKEDLNHYL